MTSATTLNESEASMNSGRSSPTSTHLHFNVQTNRRIAFVAPQTPVQALSAIDAPEATAIPPMKVISWLKWLTNSIFKHQLKIKELEAQIERHQPKIETLEAQIERQQLKIEELEAQAAAERAQAAAERAQAAAERVQAAAERAQLATQLAYIVARLARYFPDKTEGWITGYANSDPVVDGSTVQMQFQLANGL
ncbi:hypothetical protein HDU99_005282, partial [Rhizoclosmatium hyalinum]